LPSDARGTTTVSSVGGANWCRAVGFAAPIASPIRSSARPRSCPISPADTDERWTDEPCSNTRIAVTLSSPSRPNRNLSRTVTVPERIRA
jgi:hypothetical protein